jgi:hypothetical protein
MTNEEIRAMLKLFDRREIEAEHKRLREGNK